MNSGICASHISYVHAFVKYEFSFYKECQRPEREKFVPKNKSVLSKENTLENEDDTKN